MASSRVQFESTVNLHFFGYEFSGGWEVDGRGRQTDKYRLYVCIAGDCRGDLKPLRQSRFILPGGFVFPLFISS